MVNDMGREIPLLAPENLPLALGKLGTITDAKLVMPGVYEAVLEAPETAIGMEAYIVLKSASEISSAAKKYVIIALSQHIPKCWMQPRRRQVWGKAAQARSGG